MKFKEFSRNPPKIHWVFKTVQTLDEICTDYIVEKYRYSIQGFW